MEFDGLCTLVVGDCQELVSRGTISSCSAEGKLQVERYARAFLMLFRSFWIKVCLGRPVAKKFNVVVGNALPGSGGGSPDTKGMP